MRIAILYFGVLREVFGLSDETVELTEGATVGEMIGILRGRTSNASRSSSEDEGIWRSLAVAVNREYASLEVVLRDGDEVALLPPVSGGCCGAARTAKSSVRLQMQLRADAGRERTLC